MGSTGQHFPNMKASILTSTLLALASTLVALASANTCSDCTALVNAIRAYTTSDEDITYQQGILVGALCPSAEDPAQCESALPDFWKAIALRLWPAYYDPEVTSMKMTIDDNITIMIHQRPSGCADTCADPQD